jgi:hypothetical protein
VRKLLGEESRVEGGRGRYVDGGCVEIGNGDLGYQ